MNAPPVRVRGVVPSRRQEPEAIRRSMRFIALARAAARYVVADRALEIGRSLAGVDEDLVTVDVLRASIEKRRQHHGLIVENDDVDGMARALLTAWGTVPA